MQIILNIITFITAHFTEVMSAVGVVLLAFVALLHALIAIFKIIPGDQPDKILQAIADIVQKWADFLKKFPTKAA